MRICESAAFQTEWFEELRADDDWAGIKSNYRPSDDDDDDDDDDW